MRRTLLLLFWQFGLLSGGRLFADVVTLNDGRQISGLVESGNIQELHIKVGDQSQTIDIHQVQAIQFGISLPATSPPNAAEPTPAAAATTVKAGTSAAAAAASPPNAAEPAPATAATTVKAGAAAQGDTLILKDGTHVAGRWWSVDTSRVHLLVNNQLQHYPRPDVSAVTFAGATLPAPPPPATSSATPSATPASAPSSAAPPARAPTLARSSTGPPPQPPTLIRPSESTKPSAPARGLSQPEQIGVVYFWNGKVLTPLESKEAVERRSGSTSYFEMPGPKSGIRLNEAGSLVFIVRLPQGVDPASYSLFPLATVNGSRRTRSQTGRRGVLLTWPVDIEKNDESSLMTYAFRVRDLPIGEYSFSPSGSNDSYCFGVDPATPGQ